MSSTGTAKGLEEIKLPAAGTPEAAALQQMLDTQAASVDTALPQDLIGKGVNFTDLTHDQQVQVIDRINYLVVNPGSNPDAIKAAQELNKLVPNLDPAILSKLQPAQWQRAQDLIRQSAA